MYGNSFQTMDLSCPSLLMDTLVIEDQTSDYGSRETSDSKPSIGGLCQLLRREARFLKVCRYDKLRRNSCYDELGCNSLVLIALLLRPA